MDKKLTPHANERYFDRSNQEVTRKKLINHINNGGEINYAMRLTATRSLAYIPIKGEVFKVVINRRSKRLVSILPFRDNYAINVIMYSEHYNKQHYMVKLFPDCYKETQERKQALTKIYVLGEDKVPIEEIPYQHPFFCGLFEAALNFYLGTKRINKNANKNSSKAEATTIVIKEPELYSESTIAC